MRAADWSSAAHVAAGADGVKAIVRDIVVDSLNIPSNVLLVT